MTLPPALIWTLALSGASASLVWLVQPFLIWWHLVRPGRMLQIAILPPDEPAGGWPSLAVIFAARNEAAAVEAATRSLLAQDYPNLELIAVDDRSTDATGAILDRIAAADPRLRVLHVHELPPGWLGKNHALQRGAEAAAVEWLLFTDADVVFAPATLRRAMSWTIREHAQHVTAAPEVPTESVGERLYLAMFGLLFLLYSPVWRVEDRRSGAHIGIGAFNLLPAEIFRAIGGFRGLALTIDDDMRLGQVVKAAGYHTRVLLGYGTVTVRWHVGAWGMIRGVEKNFFAGLDFSVAKLILGILFILWLGAAPHVGLFVGPWWTRAMCALGVASLALLMGQTAWQSRIPWYYALFMPASAALCAFALARSAWFTLLRRGVRWREHHYPLKELRKHVRQRNRWTREVWRSTR